MLGLHEEPEIDECVLDWLVLAVALFERFNIIAIKTYEGKWSVDLRWRERQHYRSRMMPSLAEALKAAQTGRAAMVDAQNGKHLLVELLHTGAVNKEDVEWAVGRFDSNGEFCK
jgi:hypothetical protein